MLYTPFEKMSSYYVSSYGNGDLRGGDGPTEHYAPPVGGSVTIGTGGHSGINSTVPFDNSSPYDPSRVYHQMGTAFNNPATLPAGYSPHPAQRYAAYGAGQPRGLDVTKSNSAPTVPPLSAATVPPPHSADQQAYFAPHPQHIRPPPPQQQQQQHLQQQSQSGIGSPEASHLYRPASPMISAMAPQHGSPPESTSPHPQTHHIYQQHSAGHPSFQAQHHRHVTNNQQQQQPQQHLIGQHPQYPHGLIQHSISHADSPNHIQSAYNNPPGGNSDNFNPADLGYQDHQSPVSIYSRSCSNNNNINSNYNSSCHTQLDANNQPPVIADLDQLQQQQRQQQHLQQQQQLCASGQPLQGGKIDSQLHSIHPSLIQHPVVENVDPQQQRQQHAIHQGLIGTGASSGGGGSGAVPQAMDDMLMDHHLTAEEQQQLRLQQQSPLDGSQVGQMMDGESPPESLQDSPLYPWMRSQFGKHISVRFTFIQHFGFKKISALI